MAGINYMTLRVMVRGMSPEMQEMLAKAICCEAGASCREAGDMASFYAWNRASAAISRAAESAEGSVLAKGVG